MSELFEQGLALFARSWMLPAALVAGAIVSWIGWRTDARRRSRLAQLGDVPVLERLVPRRSAGLPPRVRAVMLGLAAVFVGVALAGPRWGERAERRRDLGIDIALVLDVSASMLAIDEGASRLDQMKSDVRRLLATMPAARLALLVVAGRSYVLTPLTADHDALGLFLDGLDPGMVSQGGTALAQGVTQATQLLGVAQDGGDRALVVMSDGETWDDEGEIATAAKAAGDAHIAVVTVGYGTAAGGTIPLGGGELKRDADGKPVITRASAPTLEGIARLADGVFVDAVSADRPGRVRSALRRLRQTARVYNAGTSPIQRYSLFLWPAFALLLLDALLADRSRRGTRTAAIAIALLALLGVASPEPVHAQQSDTAGDAITLYKLRRFPDAVRAIRERIAAGDRTLRNQYNLGTALLEADSIAAATEVLDRVVTIAPDAELRYRALYNLGLANLRHARSVTEAESAPFYAAAVAAYKRALRTRTDDADAKWNLELSLREQQKGGGGGRGGGGGGGGGQKPPPPSPPPGKGQQQLDKQRAEAVLNSAARDEREVQTRRQRDGQRREAPVGKDW